MPENPITPPPPALSRGLPTPLTHMHRGSALPPPLLQQTLSTSDVCACPPSSTSCLGEPPRHCVGFAGVCSVFPLHLAKPGKAEMALKSRGSSPDMYQQVCHLPWDPPPWVQPPSRSTCPLRALLPWKRSSFAQRTLPSCWYFPAPSHCRGTRVESLTLEPDCLRMNCCVTFGHFSSSLYLSLPTSKGAC